MKILPSREGKITRKNSVFMGPQCRKDFLLKVVDGPYKTEEGPGPEYETCCTFGTLIMNKDLAGVIKANELCNRAGMDTISGGAAIAFAYECYEKGIITRKET